MASGRAGPQLQRALKPGLGSENIFQPYEGSIFIAGGLQEGLRGPKRRMEASKAMLLAQAFPDEALLIAAALAEDSRLGGEQKRSEMWASIALAITEICARRKDN